jgi:phosphoglycolate phosphatase
MAAVTSDDGSLSPYDYWLFDLDGTLVDVEEWYVRRTFDRVAETLDRPFTDREMDLLWHGLGGPRDPLLREWGIDPGAFWPAFHDAENPRLRAEATYLHEDAAFVGDLSAPVGLVTHCQSFLTDPVLDRLDIRDWFDAVVCCTEELGWKPDPAPVEHARTAIDARGRGVLAGDMPSDVGAAWNAGLDAIHVERHGPDRRGRCVLGDYRVASFDDLASLRS